MRAVVCNELGPVEDLVVEERPSPPLGPDDVRLEVSACGVNYVEGLMVQGRYQVKIPAPFTPGMEVVGRVVERGAQVVDRQVGQRLFVDVGIGGYVDELVVPAARTVPLPDELTDGQGATFMQSYLTGWFALRERIDAHHGQTMLVLGAGSGVGLAAVDLGDALGLRVMAAASSEEKRQLARHRGATWVIDSSTEDVKARARELGGGGVDIVYDPVGGELGEACLRALGDEGTHLVIGFVAGIPQLPANQVLLRNRRVVGVEWGGWAGRHPERNRALVAEVLDLVRNGRIHPVEPHPYPLADAGRALRDLAERRVAGKVALVP
ncbi:NADPH:quinone oxidoreductase family protein [Rhabdothermincola salaria]|uniref:NADPH:quinone oxidoreductase family protein n=1 Tax=Rhabdothermincola salaria TaxID=2903142 RepID=UPI001E49C5B4|nr:NADPH:quinone oxidoreductase family protein [Rhabdothermincola salaria]MCD9623291.1 NADPH:quinone oxidoreductase family protein [Rhabdothermincola salaria]